MLTLVDNFLIVIAIVIFNRACTLGLYNFPLKFCTWGRKIVYALSSAFISKRVRRAAGPSLNMRFKVKKLGCDLPMGQQLEALISLRARPEHFIEITQFF